MDLCLEIIAVLMMVAFVAGIVDAIAGGGGLITVPALLLAGLDPVAAVATNKLQGTFGVASASYSYARAGLISRADARLFFVAALAGGLTGALLVSVVPSDVLRALMPLLLIAVAVYVGVGGKERFSGARERLSAPMFAGALALPIAAYDGFFGPGAGTLYTLALVLTRGHGLIEATGRAKLMNFGSNAGALLMFLLAGSVHIGLGIAMGLAAALGARLGSALAIRSGARLIRPLLVFVSTAMALRLLADPAQPLRPWLAALLV